MDRTMPIPAEFFHAPQSAPVFGGILILIMILFALLTIILMVVVFCKICSKAGYHWALGLLMLVPIANVILPFVLAFTDWPIQKELRQLKQQ
jgi:hypothetical protein